MGSQGPFLPPLKRHRDNSAEVKKVMVLEPACLDLYPIHLLSNLQNGNCNSFYPTGFLMTILKANTCEMLATLPSTE